MAQKPSRHSSDAYTREDLLAMTKEEIVDIILDRGPADGMDADTEPETL